MRKILQPPPWLIEWAFPVLVALVFALFLGHAAYDRWHGISHASASEPLDDPRQ